jgi:hypothetical protein
MSTFTHPGCLFTEEYYPGVAVRSGQGVVLFSAFGKQVTRCLHQFDHGHRAFTPAIFKSPKTALDPHEFSSSSARNRSSRSAAWYSRRIAVDNDDKAVA